jgi:4-amino-4-deoxy-L-arabinose transferase-like glycosyltransferase
MEPVPVSGTARSRRLLYAATLLFAAVGVFGLVSARGTFSGTFDESNHLACGLEWWQFGSYSMWTENPPLPRIAVAALPYASGMRLPPREAWDARTHDWDRSWEVGLDLLYGAPGFDVSLRRARLGTLPFFGLALAAVWGLAGGRRRPGAGLVAVALTATIPALFGHGALATTDVAFAGTFLLVVLTLVRWYETPTRTRALALGASFALALLCKFSTLAFVPVAVVAVAGARRLAKLSARPFLGEEPLPWRHLAGHALLSLATALLVTWAGYRFSIGRIDDLAWEVKGWLPIVPEVTARGTLGRWLLHARVPMPELFHGLRFLAAHDAVGHEAYLLGDISDHGFRLFYPIALLVKTPLPTLILLALCLPFLVRPAPSRWRALALALAAVGIVLVSTRSHINLGIRHVFVVLPLLIVALARTIDERAAVWQGRLRTALLVTVALCLAGQAAVALAARRTALGYFNVLAGADPAKVLLDSDLDWGQDLYHLRAEARARGIDSLRIAYFGTVRQCRHGLPRLLPLLPGRPATGWIAISENYYRNRSTFMLLKDPCDPKSHYRDGEVPLGSFSWLESHAPVAIAGSSIRLYHLP